MDVRCLECGEQDGPRPYSSSVFLSLAIQHVMSPIKIARHAYEVSQITGHGSAGRAVSSDPARHFQGIDARMQHMPKSKGVSDEARQRVPCYVPSVCMHNKVAPAVLQSACC